MTVVLKLGGSVITEKTELETVAADRLGEFAAAIAESDVSDLVVVHGAGSFGHPAAAEHGASDTDGTEDAAAVRDIAWVMEDLNREVVGALADAGVPAVPVHPFSAGHRDEDAALSLLTGHVGTMLDEGFIPVLHGDILTHAGAGATILSGDEVVTHLVAELDADRVGLCSTVPGVLDDDGDVIPEISAFEDAASALGESDATDVTGGMAAKVKALLDLGSPAFVFGPTALPAFLAGADAGTRIEG
jgi:isopentenyl phosphate kinase